MTRIIVMSIIMAFAVGFVGCRSCLAPYDHCQPTFLPERGDQCMGELYRCGSILGGAEQASNVNGDCPECGGGTTEYYTPEGTQIETAPATNVGSVQSAPAYAENVISAPYGSDFSLNDDAGEAY
ncbi:MAG: hypothetical protein II561_08070 [Thermoguttaceae bacterium]|nr:hypothetical protein [Thermoguttaceae bacterium]MBQ2038854.1 hypothetical protein [Thermoguttaceae bacterium]MBQ2556495.1 hypothetical protein [Thermoguttaceae bacterium]MBQ3823160.1 hypothetical protein [Thermoguttaceae bacterium]MBQ4195783.1 hypothetical protein [Thermoguttaceae bacterium]